MGYKSARFKCFVVLSKNCLNENRIWTDKTEFQEAVGGKENKSRLSLLLKDQM